MTVIGSASINIRADDKYFEPDVRRAVAKIKDLRVALKVDADMSAANKKLRDLRYRMSQNEVQIKIRANDVSFEADVRAAVRKIKNVTIDLKADVDSSKASKKIRDLRYRITSKPAILKVDANVAKAEEKMRKLLEKFTESTVNITAKAHTGAAHTALSDLQTRYGKNVNYTATADTKVARAALALVARNRRAKITAFIDPATGKALQGLFNTITGTLPFDKIKSSIVGVVASFEGLAVKAAAVGSTLLSVGALALTAGANIFSIAGDITQVVGIAAMLPAAFIAMGVGIAATKMAWKGFGEALSEDPKKAAKAMAELPPEAQAAADSVRGLGKEIQKATQAKFWEALGTSLQDMVTNLLPQLKEGFEYVGTAIGTLQAATFDGISKSLGDGVLLGILTNVGDMFSNMTKGVGDFIQGITTLGSVGATYLPQFGTYLSDAGTKFGEFIRKADEAGKINVWIETAVRRFQELGSIVKSTTSIMTGLTEIARMSGAPGLTQMADGFANIAKVVNSEPFQSQLLAILEGARTGTEALGRGLETLTELFWDSAESIGAFLELGGQIAGLTFENITKLFDGTGLGSGLYDALQGFKDGMGDLGPAFRDMGSAIGDLGRIAGELFRNMAPGLNMLAETIAGVVDGLADGIIDVMPIFNAFAQAILSLASGPLIALAQGVGNILTTFSELPGVVQTVIMSLGLFLLLKPKFDKFFGGMSASLRKEESNIGRTYRNLRTNSVDTAAMLRSDMGRVGGSIRDVMTTSSALAGQTAGKIQSAFGSMANGMKSAMAPMTSSIKNALMVEGDLNRVRRGFNDVAYNAATKFAAVSMAANMNAQTMGRHFTDASDKVNTRLADIGSSAKRGFGAVGTAAASAKDSVTGHMRSMASSIDGHLGRISPSAQKGFNTMALSAQAATVLARDHISRMPEAMGSAASRIGDSFKTATTTIGSSFGTIGTQASAAAGRVGTALAPARKAFSDLATHATTMGATAGRGLTGGISAAAGGLSGALGGPWGIAIAGATIALGAFAAKAADTKASVTELGDALAAESGEWTAASEKLLAGKLLDGVTNMWDDYYRETKMGAQKVEETLNDLGLSALNVSKKLADPEGRDAYLQSWSDISGEMLKTGKVSDELAGKVDLTSEAFANLSQADIEWLRTQMEGVGEQASAAEVRAKALGEAFEVSSIQGARLAANFDVLESTTSSVSDKFAALKSNIDIQAEGMLTAAGAAKTYHQSVADTDKAMAELSSREGVVVADLYSVADGFDFASQAGRDMHTALEGSADAILMTATQAFDAARKGGKSMEDSQAIALQSMDAPMQSFRQSLANMGLLPAQIDSIVASFGLVPESVETALLANGDSAVAEAMRTELAMASFAAGNYEAVLAALPDEAKAAIGESLGMAEEFAKGDYAAILKALDETPGGMEAALIGLTTYEGKEWDTLLTAKNMVPDKVAEANEAIQALIPRKDIELVAEDLASGVMDTVAAYSLDGKTVDLGAEDNISTILSTINASPLMDKESQLSTKDLVSQSVADLNDLYLNDKMTELQANDLVSRIMSDINAGSLDDKAANFTANDLASLTLLNLNETDFADKDAKITAQDLTQAPLATAQKGFEQLVDKFLGIYADDETAPGVESVRSTVEGGLAGVGGAGGGMSVGMRLPISVEDLAAEGTASAANTMATGVTDQHRSIWANNNTVEGTAAAQGTMGGLTDVWRGLFGVNNTGAATGEAQGTMGSLTDVWRGLFGVNNTGAATGEAQGTMSTLGDVWRGLFASNNTGGATGSAQGTMNTLQNVMRELQATNATGGATAASQGTMNSLQNVMRALQAQNSTGAATAASQNTMNSLRNVIRQLEAQNAASGGTAAAQNTMNGLRDVERELRARNRAGEGVSAAQGVINSLVGKTVDVVTRFFKIGDNADGGLWGGDGTRVMAQGGIMKSANNSAVQAFANGGINRGAQQQAIKAFAGGGIENHTAQIARGAWPVRIWAEPETGGEAYIPLSPNKRKRSLAILKQVMSEFGLEHLTHSFADGGINKAQRYSTPTVISSRYAAASTGSVSPAAQPTTQAAAPVIHVHPSQGLNEEQIGVIASDRLWFNIQNSSF